MWQGCPLTPYLFLIVGKTYNAKIYEEQRLGRIKGIHLPMLDRRQIIAQYANDISFTLKAFQKAMIWLAQLLDLFNITSSLQINHAKFVTFWIGDRKEGRPT